MSNDFGLEFDLVAIERVIEVVRSFASTKEHADCIKEAETAVTRLRYYPFGDLLLLPAPEDDRHISNSERW